MSETSPGSNGALDEAVAEVVDAFVQQVREGRPPEVEEVARRHPHIADILRQVLPALPLLQPLAQSQSDSGPAPSPEELGSVGSRLGDFRILGDLGRGGMGIVYRAEQISLRRAVALKVLPAAATLDGKQLQRFHNEAQAAASLQHGHIVPVYAIGCEKGVHYYAMQLIEGLPLTAILQQQRQLQESKQRPPGEQKSSGTAEVSLASTFLREDSLAADPSAPEVTTAYPPPSPLQSPSALLGKAESASSAVPSESVRDYYRWVTRLGVQAAEALDHAHQMGVVHRDVKPANLLLDTKGQVWVTDFGLAQIRQQEGNLTQTGDIVGTIRYMSPEQALAQRDMLDQRSDVYSLGATLYELLTLRAAFISTDRQELLRQVISEEPSKPRQLRRSIPVDLETIVLKAMEKRPQDRYSTAQELADDLQRFLDDQPIQARRPSLLQRSVKWGRRHRPAVTAGFVVLLMAVGIAGWAGWSRHDRALERAASEQVVRAALDDSSFWQEQRRLPEALSAARRAAGMLAGVEVSAELRQQAQARLADLELVERLESVRLEAAAEVKDGHPDFEGTDTLYRQRFQEVGLDVEALSAEEAGQRIGRSTVAVELAAVLDDWAWVRKGVTGPADPGWKHLLAVARLADPDGTRIRLRLAMVTGDLQVLRRLIASEEALLLPPTTQGVLGKTFLGDKKSRGALEQFLLAAQHQTPNDFWLNEILVEFYHLTEPTQREELVRFATAVVALRPESAPARLHLGLALANKGRLDDAIAEYHKAIQINKDDTLAHYSLGNALRIKGQLDEAIAEYHKAIQINKDFAEAYVNLGIVLAKKSRLDAAIAEFRTAIHINKDHAPAHCNMGVALHARGRLDEAIAEFRTAIQINKDYAVAHYNLGDALKNKGQLDDAIAEYHKAIQINTDYAEAHNDLGCVLKAKGRLGEAIAEWRKAIQINKDYDKAHINLGDALQSKGQLDEAIAEFRTAIQINKDFAPAHYNLGNALKDKGRLDEAIAEWRQAIQINKDYALAHLNLGNALHIKGQLDEAIAEWRTAIHIDKDTAEAHNNLGVALQDKGRLDEAIAEYRTAIDINKDFAEAHCTLGLALQQQGQLAEALAHLRRGHQLGSSRPGWPYPSAQWVRDCERLLDLDRKLPAILAGQQQPDNVEECLALAQLCQQTKHLYAAAVRFYDEAFDDKPQLADDLNAQHRYNAACAAARAGCGQGKDVDKLDAKERARLREQALDWLRADLNVYRQVLEKSTGKAGPAIAQRLQHWLEDNDFAGVRDEKALHKLPRAEHKDWQKLWEDVEALRQRATQQPKTANPARP